MPPRRSKVIEPPVLTAAAPASVEANVVPPRKSKKAIKVVAVVTSNGIEGSFAPEPRRPLIAHLQIHSNEVKFHDTPILYDPAPPIQPEPYDFSADNFFFSKQESLDEKVEEEKVVEATQASKQEEKVDSTAPMPAFVRAGLLVQFRASSDAKELPSSSDVSCFWCTQSFEGQPCIIPEREDKGLWRVYGNFCCPECGVSYLLNESIDPHVRWERMALLHRLYDPEGIARIFPAPPRESLKLFGGPMSIETFRATTRAGKVRVDIHMPPMVSILGSIDTKPIDFFDSNMKNTLQEKGVVKTEEGLRLKRSKPLKDRDSTLDSVMNIQIRGGKR